jgi:hypothetical protein
MAEDIADPQQVACIPTRVGNLPCPTEPDQSINSHEYDEETKKTYRETSKTHPVSC